MQNANMRFLFLGLLATAAVLTQAESDFYCYQCSDASDNEECKIVTTCPEKSKCLTQIHFTSEGLILQKRCSKMQMCYNYEENNEDKCSQPDEEFEGICSYCCDTAGCNKGMPPYGEHHVQNDDSSSSKGLGGIFNLQSLVHKFNSPGVAAHTGHSGSKSGPKSAGKGHPYPGGPLHGGLLHGKAGGKSVPKPDGKSGPKPGGLSHGKAGGKSGPKPGVLSHGKAGGQTGPKPGGLSHGKAGGKSGPKPGVLSHGKAGGQTGPKPGGLSHGKAGGKTGPKSGGLSNLKTPLMTKPTTASTSAPSKPPATKPPVTSLPVQTNNNIVGNTCHCHSGQPCYASHVNNGQAARGPVGPGIDVNIHIDLGSLLGLNLGTCPCANQKPVVKVQQATVPPPTRATSPPTAQPTTVAPPKPQTHPTSPPTTQPTAPPSTQRTTQPTTKPKTQPTTRPTTTVPTTRPTTTIPTTTVRPTYCYTCTDKSCYDMHLTACPSDQYYCLNTITQTATGSRTFTKECVLEQTCNDKWWLGTAGRPDCFLLDSSPSGPPGMPLDKCSFCCHGDGCNKDALPSSSSLYNPKSIGKNFSPSIKATTVKPPMPQTHPTISSTATRMTTTTKQPSTVTTQPTMVTTTTKQPSTVTTLPTLVTTTTKQPSKVTTLPTTVTTTTTKTPTTHKAIHRGKVITCAVCGEYDKNVPCTFLESLTALQVPCPPYHFCMTDVLYDAVGTQSLYKRCVSENQCARQWYEETSDRIQCTQMNLNNPPLKTVCHFCCKSKGCNSDTIPPLSTLYIPKHHH